jgi:hypothetical protein
LKFDISKINLELMRDLTFKTEVIGYSDLTSCLVKYYFVGWEGFALDEADLAKVVETK